MGVVPFYTEVTSPIPPAKLFKAIIIDGDKLIPRLLPQAIQNVEIIEGDGGPGTIKRITFGEGSQFKYAKHKIEGIDKDNLTYSYSVIEGDALMNVIEKISYDIKFEACPSGGGGTICKESCSFYTVGDFELEEDKIKAGKEKSLVIFKTVEAYLSDNPDA